MSWYLLHTYTYIYSAYCNICEQIKELLYAILYKCIYLYLITVQSQTGLYKLAFQMNNDLKTLVHF